MRDPRNRFLKLIKPLRKNAASLLIQFRTGHAPLNQHLHRIGCVESPDCPHCPGVEESVKHFVLDCPKYEDARREINRMDVRIGRSLGKLLSQKRLILALLRYVNRTGRLQQTFGDVESES